jgi:hypothetical protein
MKKRITNIPKLAAVVFDLTLAVNVIFYHAQTKRCDDQGKHEVMNQEKGHHLKCQMNQEA